MSKARTVPGEALANRLSERGGSRARVGPQREFYQRLGLSDPLGDPEAEEATKNGLFSFLSASRYYRELRSSRFRMMWRLGAIRHRSVAGERLRAAGPRTVAPTSLAGASLPNVSELVLIDPDGPAGPMDEDKEATPRRRRRSESPRRRRSAAARAAERSVGRSDAELTRALSQIENLLKAGSVRSQVHEIARDLPSLPVDRQVERVREVIRTVERAHASDASAAHRKAEGAERPAAVALRRLEAASDVSAPQGAGRTGARAGSAAPRPTPAGSAAAPSRRAAGRRPAAPERTERDRRIERLTTGPAGLEPILRSSPAVRASMRAEASPEVGRFGARPTAIERLAAPARRSPLLAPVAVPLVGPAEEPTEETSSQSAPVSRTVAPSAPSAFARYRARVESQEASRQAPPTARIAQSASSFAVAPLRAPEAMDTARGLDAIRLPASMAQATPVQRAVSRRRAGSAVASSEAPLAGASTSWLAEVLQPERRARGTRAEHPTRSLQVLSDLPVLEQADDQAAVPQGPARRSRPDAPASSAPRARAAAPAALGPVAAPAVGARTADQRPTTLRALSRADVPQDTLAPLPTPRVRRPSVVGTAPSMSVLAPVDEVPENVQGTPARRASSAAESARPVRREVVPAVGPAAPTVAAGRRGIEPGVVAPGRRLGVRAADAVTDFTEPTAVRPLASSEPAVIRAARRLDLRQPEQTAVAPLLERATAVGAPSVGVAGRPAQSTRVASHAGRVDLVALNPAAEDAEEGADLPRTASAGEAGRPSSVQRAAQRADEASTEDSPVRAAAVRREVASTSQPEAARRLDEDAPTAVRSPASRRAAHRAVPPASVASRRRIALAAPPAAFVEPVAAQKGLDADDQARRVRSARTRGDDAPTTRALSRTVRTARVDSQDRARLVPSATDYLDVAAASEGLFRSPVRRALPAVEGSLLFPELPSDAADEFPAAQRRRSRSTSVAADTTRPSRAVEVDAPSTSGLVRRARGLATAIASSRDEGPSRPASLTRDRDIAVRPATTRRSSAVVPVQHLAAPLRDAERVEDSSMPSVRRRELPPVSRALRQVASAFRASERDVQQVVTVDAARRAVEAAPSGARPTTTAVLERDEAGRLVRARAHRTAGSVSSAVLDFALPQLPSDEAPQPTQTSFAAARGQEPTSASPPARTHQTAALPTVLAHAPSAWAEERADDAQGVRPGRRTRRSVASPTRRAARRQARPVPEGRVHPVAGRLDPDGETHRLTAPTSARRRRFDAPGLVDLEADLPESFEDEEDSPRRRRAHSVNTWTDLAERVQQRSGSDRRGRRGRRPGSLPTEDSPGWVRRAVEPAVERSELGLAGSKVRSGSGLLTALARAADPEEIVRVIVERSSQAGALSRELPGPAGQLVKQIANHGGGMLEAIDAGTTLESRANRGEVVPSGTSRRARTAWLESDSAPSRGIRTRGGGSGSSKGNEGVGSSNVMKLAGKLKKLIHLAEHARRLDEARAAVRMAEDSAEARAEVGAGRGGGQEIEEDNMHRERLFDEVVQEVQYRNKMKEMMGGESDGGW